MTTIIPKRYKSAKFEDVPSNIQALIKNIIDSRKGIYIYGDCGTGKTHIAYAIAKYCDSEGKIRNMFFNIPELIRFLKKDFDEVNKTLSSDNTNFAEVLNYKGLLIIDDLGTEKLTDWVEETIYAIINKRYENVVPTLFTSNLSPAKLTEKYGDRIVSRIVGSCDIVELKGEDKRI
jgi:DNA replication protein DnaC